MLNVVDLAVKTRASALGEDRAQSFQVALVTTPAQCAYSAPTCLRGATDSAPAFYSEGCWFESSRGH